MSLQDVLLATNEAHSRINVCAEGLAALDKEVKAIMGGIVPPENWKDGFYHYGMGHGDWKVGRFAAHGISWIELSYHGDLPGVLDIVRRTLGKAVTRRPDVPSDRIWIALTV